MPRAHLQSSPAIPVCLRKFFPSPDPQTILKFLVLKQVTFLTNLTNRKTPDHFLKEDFIDSINNHSSLKMFVTFNYMYSFLKYDILVKVLAK